MTTKTETTKKKVYISGPITGYDLKERKLAFLKIQHMLEYLDYQAVNPFDNGVLESANWHMHMHADLRMLLDCDAVYMMPGWEMSNGCKLELNVATSCGIPVMIETNGI